MAFKVVCVPLKLVAPMCHQNGIHHPLQVLTEPGQGSDWALPPSCSSPRTPPPPPRDLQAGLSVQEAKAPGFSGAKGAHALPRLPWSSWSIPSQRGAHPTPSSSRASSPYLPSLGQSSSPYILSFVPQILASSLPHLPDPHLGRQGSVSLAKGSVELETHRWPASGSAGLLLFELGCRETGSLVMGAWGLLSPHLQAV